MPHGFKIIGEMSNEELIDEIIECQRATLLKVDTDTLKAHVINFRVAETKRRLVEEANLEPAGTISDLFRQNDE